MAADLTAEQAAALEILRRRPRLAAVLIAVHEMTEGRRTCRVSLDVASGIIRIFREIPERQYVIEPPIVPGPSG